MVEADCTTRIEQQGVDPNIVRERRRVVFRVLDDAFAANASNIKPVD